MKPLRWSLVACAVILLAGCRSPFSRPAPTPTPTVAPTAAVVAQATPPPATVAPTPSAPTATQPISTDTPAAVATPTAAAAPPTSPATTAPATPAPSLAAADPPPAAATFSDALAHAIHLQDIGDSAGARREFATLIASSNTPADVLEARYRLAASYLSDLAYTEAVTAFVNYLANAPQDDERYRWALFMLGRAQEGSGQTPQAIQTYQAYIALQPPLAFEAHYRIGLLHEQASEYAAAAESYLAALDTAPASDADGYRERLAQSYLALNEIDRGIAQYEMLLTTANSYRQAQLHYTIGLILEDAGQPAAALTRFRQALEAEPRSTYAYAALVMLVDAGATVDEYVRGMTDFYAAAYDPAIAAFERYLAANPTSERADAARYYLGRSQFALGHFTAAIQTYDRLMQDFPQSPYFDDAWLGKAATQGRLGNVPEARATYQSFARQFPQHERAPEALWEAVELLKNINNYEGAAIEYLDLRRLHPNSSQAPNALYWAGIYLYRLGQYNQAAEAMRDLAASYPASGLLSAALFWQGKSVWQTGDTAGANALWTRLHEVEPDGWYVVRAEALGAPLRPRTPPPDASQETAEAWLRDWTQTAVTGEALRGLPPEIANDPAFRRGREYLAVELERQGLAELEAVYNRWRDDPIAMYQLALAMQELGAYRLSLLSATRVITLSPTHSIEQAPAFIARLAYPTHYGDLIRAAAEQRDLDPWLLFGLIRQESQFDAGARSSADARGLGQVIPDTGDWVALQLGLRNFDPDDLFRPYVSVRFGAYYLSWVLDYMDDDLYMALAGYNGGPGNATEWRRRAGPDDDLFVATIGAFESRTYVRVVTVQYAIYRWLYGSE